MLYKNDVVYELSRFPKEIEAIERHFHNKFPIKVVYPANRIQASKLKHNRVPDKPASISFDLKAIVKTPTGTEVWRYAENVLVDGTGKKKYMPKKFIFTGDRWLTRNDIELIYFLLRKSEYCSGGDNEGGMPKFMFQDLVSEAEKKAEKKKIEAKLTGLLYGDDFGLSEEKLRAVAKAYQIMGVDDLSLAQVQFALDNKIHETKTGPQAFFTMVGDEEQIKTRVAITKVIDMELIKYDSVRKLWQWQTKGEQGNTTICKVPPNKSASETLYDYYQGDDNFKEDIQALLISKTAKPGKAKKEMEPAEKEE